MAESQVHRTMKRIVSAELTGEGYVLLEEPLFPPSRRIAWKAYRPDILGYRGAGGREEVAIVECETHPNMRRFESKNYSTLTFQPYLFRDGAIRRILAVPQGKLRSVDLRLRREWEVWVLGSSGPLCKIGRTGDRPVGNPPRQPERPVLRA